VTYGVTGIWERNLLMNPYHSPEIPGDGKSGWQEVLEWLWLFIFLLTPLAMIVFSVFLAWFWVGIDLFAW
jgi:hypothetical protein